MSDTDPEVLALPEESFGHLLARYRRSARLTQEELASSSGISTRSISDMERGRVRGPQQRTAQALATALALDSHAQWEFLRIARAGRTRPAEPADPETEPSWQIGAKCQLPPVVADFTGRKQELARITQAVEDHRHRGTRATPVVALFGAPGVGKTTLAVFHGHQQCERFPDGLLFLGLRGTNADRLSSYDSLGRLLTALGVSADRLPPTVEERTALYRLLLGRRRVLLILDNAADEAQVRPLLPISPGSLVLLTSRQVLSGLEAVSRIQLDVLATVDGERLLSSIVGPERAEREPAMLRRVVKLCGNLPLALRIAGNRLASRPRWQISHLVHQLDDEHQRLNVLTAGDLQVRATFEESYRRCDTVSRLVFRRLSLAYGPDTTAAHAAILAGLDEPTAERHLEELVDASLLEASAVEGRYVHNDLLRLFARELMSHEDTAADIREAEQRLTEWLLRNGTHAGLLIAPDPNPVLAEPEPDWVAVTEGTAVRWLDAEREHWLAALRAAVGAGRHATVLAFAGAMRWYPYLRADAELWREVFTHGVNAAVRLGRRRELATQLNFLGWALARSRHGQGDAVSTHRRALAIARETGDRAEEAWAVHYIARSVRRDGKPEEAIGLYGKAIGLFPDTGHTFGEQIVLYHLGIAQHSLGRYEEAAGAYRTAIAVFRRADTVSHHVGLALTLLRLAETMEATGAWEAANDTFREAGALALDVDAPLSEGQAWFGCGRCRHELGDLRLAEGHLDIALGVFGKVGERWMQARVLYDRASVLDQVDAERACSDRERALELCQALGTPRAKALAASLTAALAATNN